MMRRILAASLLPSALVLGGLTVGTGVSGAAPAPIRIMFNGDSTTQQFSGDYSWRYRLIKEIQRQIAGSGKTIDMVGPYKLPSPGVAGYHVKGWDADHDAIGGSKLKDHVTGGGYDIGALLRDHPGYRPDVLFSYLGTNDMLVAMAEATRQYPGPDQRNDWTTFVEARIQPVIDNYVQFVGEVRTYDPGVTIVLGQLMTQRVPQAIRDAYNDALASQVVDGLQSATSPIALARLDRPEDRAKWDDTRYTFDLVHPTPSGELLMAQRFGEALHSIDTRLLPDQAKVAQVYVPWAPALAPRIRVFRGRIHLSCFTAMKANGVLQLRVRMMTLRSGRTALGSFAKKTAWSSARLRPGYYRIAAQGLRAYVTTPWTRSYTVHVPRPRH